MEGNATEKIPEKSHCSSEALKHGCFTLNFCEKRCQGASICKKTSVEHMRRDTHSQSLKPATSLLYWHCGAIFLSFMDMSKYSSILCGLDLQGKVIPFPQSYFPVYNHINVVHHIWLGGIMKARFVSPAPVKWVLLEFIWVASALPTSWINLIHF